MEARRVDEGGREDRHHLVAGSADAEQLPGRRPLQRGRPRDCRGRRSDAAGADRGVQATHHRRPQARDRTARREARRSQPADARHDARRGRVGMGRQPDFDRAAVGRAVGSDQARRLVARVRHDVHQQLAAADVGLHEAPPVHRLVGRVRHRLRRAGGGRRGARQPEARAPQRQHPVRRRSELRARACCGRRRITRFRCSPSCTTTAPIIRSGCTSPTWRRARTATSAARNIGNELNDPAIDYASLAKAYGVYGQGPIDNPNDLGPAIRKAIEVVKTGEPALVDVVTQPR